MESSRSWVIVVIVLALLAAGAAFFLFSAREAQTQAVSEVRRVESAEMHQIIHQQQTEIEELRKALEQDSKATATIRSR